MYIGKITFKIVATHFIENFLVRVSRKNVRIGQEDEKTIIHEYGLLNDNNMSTFIEGLHAKMEECFGELSKPRIIWNDSIASIAQKYYEAWHQEREIPAPSFPPGNANMQD